MKLSKEILAKQNEIENAKKEHIETFLKKMADKELEIITPNLDVIYGSYDCSIQTYSMRFHYAPQYKNVIKKMMRSASDYKIIDSDNDRILVKVGYVTIKIPYEYDKKYLNDFMETFFSELKKDIRAGLVRKNKSIEEHKNWEKEEKDIRRERTCGKYHYTWKDCPQCYSEYVHQSDGKVTVGTGEYEEDPFSRSGCQREVTTRVNCPRCKGTAGLVVFDDGWSKSERPYSKYAFKHDRDDFMTILADSGNN